MDIEQTVDLIRKKKYGYGMNSILEFEIMVEGNRRLDFKREKNRYWTNERFDPKNYEKLSVRQIRDQNKNFLTLSDLLTQLTILGKGNRKLDLKKQKMMGIGKIGDLNVKIMWEGNRRLDFIQKEIGIRQIGDLT